MVCAWVRTVVASPPPFLEMGFGVARSSMSLNRNASTSVGSLIGARGINTRVGSNAHDDSV